VQAKPATPTVYNLSSDLSSFTSSALTGLGPNTIVTGVSPGGSWLSGSSDTSTSDETTLGIAWQSSAPGNPISAGTPLFDPVSGLFDDVTPTEAWDGGIVGSLIDDFFGGSFTYRWEAATNSTSFTDGPLERSTMYPPMAQ